MYEHIKSLGKKKMMVIAGADNLTALQTYKKFKDLGIADFILTRRIEKNKEIAD